MEEKKRLKDASNVSKTVSACKTNNVYSEEYSNHPEIYY